MMIGRKTDLFRFWPKMAKFRAQALIGLLCALSWSVPAAAAAPLAQPGPALSPWQGWAPQPLIRASFCEEDGSPCPNSDSGHYPARPVHARRWEPAPEPYVEERTVVHVNPDCVEERYAARERVAYQTAARPRPEEGYDEQCGIKCWYRRLREGYCGRGCDYYRFRMTEFREGRLSDRVHVVCR